MKIIRVWNNFNRKVIACCFISEGLKLKSDGLTNKTW